MNINICTKWIQSRVTGRPKLSNSEVVAQEEEEEEEEENKEEKK